VHSIRYSTAFVYFFFLTASTLDTQSGEKSDPESDRWQLIPEHLRKSTGAEPGAITATVREECCFWSIVKSKNRVRVNYQNPARSCWRFSLGRGVLLDLAEESLNTDAEKWSWEKLRLTVFTHLLNIIKRGVACRRCEFFWKKREAKLNGAN
jgi:hypothetical protein